MDAERMQAGRMQKWRRGSGLRRVMKPGLVSLLLLAFTGTAPAAERLAFNLVGSRVTFAEELLSPMSSQNRMLSTDEGTDRLVIFLTVRPGTAMPVGSDFRIEFSLSDPGMRFAGNNVELFFPGGGLVLERLPDSPGIASWRIENSPGAAVGTNYLEGGMQFRFVLRQVENADLFGIHVDEVSLRVRTRGGGGNLEEQELSRVLFNTGSRFQLEVRAPAGPGRQVNLQADADFLFAQPGGIPEPLAEVAVVQTPDVRDLGGFNELQFVQGDRLTVTVRGDWESEDEVFLDLNGDGMMDDNEEIPADTGVLTTDNPESSLWEALTDTDADNVIYYRSERGVSPNSSFHVSLFLDLAEPAARDKRVGRALTIFTPRVPEGETPLRYAGKLSLVRTSRCFSGYVHEYELEMLLDDPGAGSFGLFWLGYDLSGTYLGHGRYIFSNENAELDEPPVGRSVYRASDLNNPSEGLAEGCVVFDNWTSWANFDFYHQLDENLLSFYTYIRTPSGVLPYLQPGR